MTNDRVSTVPISRDGSTTRACQTANGKQFPRAIGSQVGRTFGNQGNTRFAQHNHMASLRISPHALDRFFHFLSGAIVCGRQVSSLTCRPTRFSWQGLVEPLPGNTVVSTGYSSLSTPPPSLYSFFGQCSHLSRRCVAVLSRWHCPSPSFCYGGI